MGLNFKVLCLLNTRADLEPEKLSGKMGNECLARVAIIGNFSISNATQTQTLF